MFPFYTSENTRKPLVLPLVLTFGLNKWEHWYKMDCSDNDIRSTA